MGNYFSILSWSPDDVQAPVLSKLEAETVLAKKKIDSEVVEIVQEIEAECLIVQTEDNDIKEGYDHQEETEPSKVFEDSSTSPLGGKEIASIITKDEPTIKEKKWYHKFTGNVQRSDEVTASILSERRIRAVEKRANAQKAELDNLLAQTNTRHKIRLLALQQKIHPDFRGKEWRFDVKKNFNFAVVGCSGVGKSTFINSLLGLKPYQPGAARVSAGVEGTLVMQPYSLPGYAHIRIWDVPGGSGIDRPADSYFEDHCLDLFDAVLYLHEGRHNVLQALILIGCATTNTPVYVIVTKMDLLVESQLENQGLEESPANVKGAIEVISETVTKECASLNQRFCQQQQQEASGGGSIILPAAKMSVIHKASDARQSLDADGITTLVCNVPFFFVSKHFKCRFGSFDAEKVISSMKAAASTRLLQQAGTTVVDEPTTSSTSTSSSSSTSTSGGAPSVQQLPLVVMTSEEEEGGGGEEEVVISSKGGPSPAGLHNTTLVSPQGSPMPFCRDSLKQETVAALRQEMGVKEEVRKYYVAGYYIMFVYECETGISMMHADHYIHACLHLIAYD